MKKLLKKIFGDLNITWSKLIIFAIIMGVYTGLMALLVPDNSSFHDIAVTPEWWVLPAIIIIVNSKKPLEAALKTFIFFLISQPIVYLVQVPFNQMGWGLFGYYRYWFMITLLTFPGAFVGWFIKKDKWYSGLILSVMVVLLVFLGCGFARQLLEHFPNHLLTTVYCFGIIPVFIIALFKDKWARIIPAVVGIATLIILLIGVGTAKPFETYNNTVFSENNIVLVGDPQITFFSATADGHADLIKTEDDQYTIKLEGVAGGKYDFTITDDEKEYNFEYYFDQEQNTVILNLK